RRISRRAEDHDPLGIAERQGRAEGRGKGDATLPVYTREMRAQEQSRIQRHRPWRPTRPRSVGPFRRAQISAPTPLGHPSSWWDRMGYHGISWEVNELLGICEEFHRPSPTISHAFAAPPDNLLSKNAKVSPEFNL